MVCYASVGFAEKLQKAKLQGTESRPVGNHKRGNCQKLAGLIAHSVNEELLPDRGSFLPQMSPPKCGPKREVKGERGDTWASNSSHSGVIASSASGPLSSSTRNVASRRISVGGFIQKEDPISAAKDFPNVIDEVKVF